ncbi:(d)CMP kinase [Flavobacteriaceae bacterium]|nr:(d)CMP kinase [Flavobacteriaceae bacterium]
MSLKIVVAIDGYSSTGKSTVAKQLAKELGYVYVDTGAMYRAVALFTMRNNLIVDGNVNTDALLKELPNITISFTFNAALGYAEVYLNNENVESYIRGMEVSSYVSKVASIKQVREKLVLLQQAMGLEKGIVMDGRDIGTVVFPEAELKLFMTASAQTRAQRRFDELTAKGDVITFEEVYNNVVERDHLDTTRKDSPLEMAKDAIEIDNSNLSKEEQFTKILNLVKAKL